MNRKGLELVLRISGPIPPGGLADLMAKINIAMPDEEPRVTKSMSIDEIPDSKSVVKSAFMQAEDELAELETKFAQLAAQTKTITDILEPMPVGSIIVAAASSDAAANQLIDCILNAAGEGVRFRAKVK